MDAKSATVLPPRPTVKSVTRRQTAAKRNGWNPVQTVLCAEDDRWRQSLVETKPLHDMTRICGRGNEEQL